jgi:large subunit ribosomal protein L22
MSVQALAKGVRMSPRKVGEVASLVRGRTVADALVILEHVPRLSAIPVRKTIESARANADYNHNYKPDSLRIVEITVNAGPRQKRFRPVARGMAHPYMHRTSHIRVVVDGEKRTPKKPATAKAPTKSATPAVTTVETEEKK